MGRLSTECVFCTMEPVYSDHNFCGPPRQVVSLDRCICKLSFTIYISYDLWYHPYCVHKLWSMPCLPMSGAETAFSHGQTRHRTCTCKFSFTIYMACDRWYHSCFVHKLWSILCLPMSGAETASSHGQTRHGTYAC